MTTQQRHVDVPLPSVTTENRRKSFAVLRCRDLTMICERANVFLRHQDMELVLDRASTARTIGCRKQIAKATPSQ